MGSRESWLDGTTWRGDECSNQVTSCVCPPVRMKETDDPDQDCGFLDNLPQMLRDLRAGWGPPAFSEESGLSPSLEMALSCTELAGGTVPKRIWL